MKEKQTRKRKPITGYVPPKNKATFYLTDELLKAINEDAQNNESNFSLTVESVLTKHYKVINDK